MRRAYRPGAQHDRSTRSRDGFLAFRRRVRGRRGGSRAAHPVATEGEIPTAWTSRLAAATCGSARVVVQPRCLIPARSDSAVPLQLSVRWPPPAAPGPGAWRSAPSAGGRAAGPRTDASNRAMAFAVVAAAADGSVEPAAASSSRGCSAAGSSISTGQTGKTASLISTPESMGYYYQTSFSLSVPKNGHRIPPARSSAKRAITAAATGASRGRRPGRGGGARPDRAGARGLCGGDRRGRSGAPRKPS